MGMIYADVESGQLAHDPRERLILEFFLQDFDVTWGAHRFGLGTAVSMYLLKPLQDMQSLFGFGGEILLVYSNQPTLQPRVLQLCDRILADQPANGRADPLVVILVSPAHELELELGQLMTDNRQSRIYVPFRHAECVNVRQPQFLRARLQQHLFTRDLFDVTHPISSDLYFFGRKSITVDLKDAVRGGENTGLFGLRKTGKTSVLLRLQRMLGHDGRGRLIYLDLQDQALYSMRWWKLLELMAHRLLGSGPNEAFAEHNAARLFRSSVQEESRRRKNRKTVFALDEIEHISPGMSMMPHWRDDFLHFWKTLRAIQNEHRNICFLVSGVNASCVETATYQGHDNPLFSMVKIRYMPPFEVEDVATMTRTLGRVMGMNFSGAANRYLRDNFGGHPLLVRMACSWIHRHCVGSNRPAEVTAEMFAQNARACNRSLWPWASHILGMLKQWYQEEHHMLECLAKGDVKTFDEYSFEFPQNIEHLKAYGLVAEQPTRLTIPFLADYLKTEKVVDRLEAAQAKESLVATKDQAQGITPYINVEVVMRDKVQVGKGIGVAGDARVHDFNQIWNELSKETDLPQLAEQLATLRAAMKKKAVTAEEDSAVGVVANAETAARQNDGKTAMEHMSKVGKWTLDVATKIGVPIAVAAIKKSMGL